MGINRGWFWLLCVYVPYVVLVFQWVYSSWIVGLHCFGIISWFICYVFDKCSERLSTVLLGSYWFSLDCFWVI